MSATKTLVLAIAFCFAAAVISCFAPSCSALSVLHQNQQSGSSATRKIGVVKAINGTSITLAPDSGPEVNVTVQDTTRVVRIAPGEKDLKNAVPISLQDVQVGDRILVGGMASDNSQSFTASSVVVMKRSDLEARHEQDLQDWQKRGVDGLAKSVDATAGTVTITVRGKDVVIHTSGGTVFRRYAPGSVKFDDAKSSTLQEIHVGDQVRARGERSADGNDLTAEEIVSGAFPLFAGTINSIDASSSTLSVHDLSSRKNVTVKITQDSQLHRLPPEMAQMIATRLKRSAAPAVPGAPQATDSGSTAGPTQGSGGRRNGMGGAGRAPDIQQVLNRTPTVSLADLHKGDAVVMLSTDAKDGPGTAIKLFTGVEPILQSAPNAAQAMMLAPWNVGGPAGDLGGP